MMRISFSEDIPSPIKCFGALDYDFRPNGVSPRRLPAWTRAQVPRVMDVIIRMPSGVRLVFQTNATEVAVSGLATNLVTPPEKKRPITMDLTCNGQTFTSENLDGNTILLDQKNPQKVELDRGEPSTWRFKNLPAGEKTCEIWLPHNAMIELHELVLPENSTISEAPRDNRKHWIHYGSSISHCMEALQPTLIWPSVAATRLNWCLQNLGFGGQCQLDQFVARTMAQSDADVLSIKTGINIVNGDTMRERIFSPLLHGFLDTIRETKEEEPIILISPIYCPSAENHPGPTIPDGDGKFTIIEGHSALRRESLTLRRIRELIQDVIERRNDQNIHYIDGLALFGESDAVDLPDDLHPNPEGYVRMGQRFAGLVESLRL